MSNARELALLKKWTSSTDGATIIPPLSSPTSPKATKFCCCPNRRRYNLKQPKLTTTLHVRNIFVDNDFNFIDDTTENDDEDDNDIEQQLADEEILNLKAINYKRAVSWPSARRAQKNQKSREPTEVEVHKENRKNQVATTNNGYDDIIEIANNNSSEKRVKVEDDETQAKEWRHDKSCHNNRNNCLTKQQQQHERKSNNSNSRCSIESVIAAADDDDNKQHQEQLLVQKQLETVDKLNSLCARQPLKQRGNEITDAATAKSCSPKAHECRQKCGENFHNTLAHLSSPATAIEQKTAITATTATSPLFQRLSEIRELKDSLCKETFSSNTQPTNIHQQQKAEEHCNNCQFCFNQSCRNFSQLQKSIQDNSKSSNSNIYNSNESSSNSQQQSSAISDNQKMTITSSTNVANNNFERRLARATANTNSSNNTNPNEGSNCGLSVTATMSSLPATSATTMPPTPPTRKIPPPNTLALSTSNGSRTGNGIGINNNNANTTTPTSPIPRSNTPSSPLTTTVIKTTMVKRSPANESTSLATSPTSSATSASLTLEKSIAFIAAAAAPPPPNNAQDMLLAAAVMAKENKSANNSKCLMDATTATDAVASSTPLSVKERIAALVAGNEQNQKQHDNFINRTSNKNQCNKPMRSTTTATTTSQQQQQNMTSPQRQQQHEQSIVINGNNGLRNMCQKSPTTASKVLLAADEIDGNTSSAGLCDAATNLPANDEDDSNVDNINHKLKATLTATPMANPAAAVVLRSSKSGLVATIPRCSLQHHNAVNKYGSNAKATSSSSEASTTTTNHATMTVDKRQQQSQQHAILSNTTSPTAASSLSNDTSVDNSNDLTAATSTSLATSCRNKLAALDNLDLALNLSELPLDVDDDDDPYFVLQEYLERVKHEINEVFELHKARQKQQQQPPTTRLPLENDTNTTGTIENQIIDTLKAAVSNDELSRSTESDSGFDSATGGGWCGNGHIAALADNSNSSNIIITTTATPPPITAATLANGGSNKLPSRAKVTTTTTSNEKQNDNNANKKDNDVRVMEIVTKNEQQQQQQQLLETTTAANGIESKPPKATLIPYQQEQGKQEQDAVATASLPYSSASSSPSSAAATSAAAAASSSTLKRLRKQLQTKSPAEVATDDVNMWANKFLRDLDNLMASDKATTTSSSAPAAARASISPGPTSPMLLSAAATAVIQSRYGKGAHDRYVVGNNANNVTALYDQQTNVAGTTATSSSSSSSTTNGIVLRPEKHATIPLQSFNLDCGRLDNAGALTTAAATSSGGNVTKTNVAYLRTLSAPTPSPSHTIYQALLHNHDNNSSGNKTTCGLSGSSSRQQLLQRNSLATGGGIFNAAFDQHHHQQQQQQHLQNTNLTNFQSNDAAATLPNGMDMSNGDIKSTMSSAVQQAPTTILKIEETSSAAKTSPATSTAVMASSESTPATDVETLHQKRLRQLNMEMDNLRNTSIDQSQQLSALMQQNHYCTGGTSGASAAAVGSPGNSNVNKHKNLMTNSSCVMPKKANSATMSTTTTTSSSIGSGTMMTCTTTMTTTPKSSSITTNATATSYLLHGGDATKKGSTSTIWTSEESILRSVGAVDEDNNSTSSSACEEASGVLSSGKSGISLDSSGVENDNNESGIGTATPPKDMSYWKGMPHHRHHHHHHHHHAHHNQQDNESVSSLDALRKMKFQKGSSVTSSDDPDLLEVLSLCDETHNDEDDADEENEDEGVSRNTTLKSDNNEEEEDMDDYDMVDEEEDEGHDEFETIPYCDCDCTEDGDASSASAGSSGTRTNSSINNGSLSDSNGGSGVVLRRKYAASPIMVPQKCRSRSLDTSSLPNSYHHVHGHPHMHHHAQHQQQAQLARKLQHLRDRHKDRNQLSLALRQEPFQSMLAPTHFHELPSPSSASLHSGHEILDTQELSTKSNSAPLLLKQEKRRDDFANQNVTLRYSRSQSDRYLAEIEAVEACKWLRAAGFPQYAQMYEDHQFPLDLTNVAKDHTNLENDQLQSLYRRLCILNRCANMRVDQSHKAQTPQKEDSDDENFALSENWTFQPHIRRWSRIGEMGLEIPPATKLTTSEKTESSSKESSPDRFEDDSYDISGAPLSLGLPVTYIDESGDHVLNDGTDLSASPLKRTGSERLKDGAKAILRRVESIKSSRRRKRQGMVLSGPQALDLSQLGQRSSMRKPDAVYSTPPSPSAVSPMHSFNKGPMFGNELKVPSQSDNFLSPNRSSPKRTPTTPRSMRTSPLHFFTSTMPHLREGKSDDSSSYYSDSQESSSAVNKMAIRKTPSKTRRFLQRTGKVDDIGAHSDSECHQGRKLLIKDANANTTEVKTKKLSRGGSLNLGRDGKKRDGFRSASFRSRSTTRKEPKPEEVEPIKRAPVVRWHSFQLEERPHMIFRKCFSQKNDPHSNEHGILFAAMSAGQLQMIRKLALVTLTGSMERYCPTHRSGWNWELPKFIKKIKMPDYKDKKVFGVPLLLILQRSGQALPVAVRSAFRWLQLNALDQVGLFRKSGVKSRILKLKELIEYSETSAECMDVFDTQQAYDVADMLKQYFRDLPESLLTTKMSETFVAIFQHLPPEVRLDAIQSAVLLLPDENREILFALLEFLTLVSVNSSYNQMTTNNLAVCLAPSLFHTSISTGNSSVTASPRRKGKGSGVPDAKELFEAKASHECLAFMIEHYKQIYTAPKEKLGKCKFGYMEESKPLPLEALGEGMQFHNWRGYLYESTSATIKEGKEKSRGWITITSQADSNVEIAYKKVGDGHPLRLWRCITEIEGPPKDVLDYIIRQRASWDPNLLQSQTIKKFDECTEIFQYAIDGQQCTDFCVLRSWRTDLPRGACVIVETSIDHAKAKPMFNAVRGVVLASRYLIEPCGSGRSRVMHLARVDVKGKTPEWYNKSYGHISSHFLTRIRLAFKNVADGPESKV